jgi:hypothetical protein
MKKVEAGEYDGLKDFVNRNNLQDLFMEAVSGDRTIEEYTEDYEEDHSLILCVINDLANYSESGDWESRVKFKNGHSNKFRLDP